jgi:glycosyltransferase involved in cell wall biosynthesis
MQGRTALPLFRKAVVSVADSEYNAEELAALGFTNIETIPVLVNFSRLDQASETSPPRREEVRANNGVTFLFVGRVVPNKRQRDLISFFAYYQHLVEPCSRLILVGSALHAPSYQLELETHCKILSVSSIEFLSHIADSDLSYCYDIATLYVSMSEHEGLGVPLLEAMYRRIPVLAFAAAAVPYTLDGAGILFHRKRYDVLAEMADLLAKDAGLRERVVQRQLERVAQFSPKVISAQWRQLLERYASH